MSKCSKKRCVFGSSGVRTPREFYHVNDKIYELQEPRIKGMLFYCDWISVGAGYDAWFFTHAEFGCIHFQFEPFDIERGAIDELIEYLDDSD